MDPKTKITVMNALGVIFLLVTIGYFISFMGAIDPETGTADPDCMPGEDGCNTDAENSAMTGCCTSFILLLIFAGWAKKLEDADKLEEDLETARIMQDAEKERLRVEREAEEARKEAEKEAERRRLRKEIEKLEEFLDK